MVTEQPSIGRTSLRLHSGGLPLIRPGTQYDLVDLRRDLMQRLASAGFMARPYDSYATAYCRGAPPVRQEPLVIEDRFYGTVDANARIVQIGGIALAAAVRMHAVDAEAASQMVRATIVTAIHSMPPLISKSGAHIYVAGVWLNPPVVLSLDHQFTGI